MDNIVERGQLYDYYGRMLTEHQQRIYEAVVYNDMSLSEIADECDISRQGVHDLIKRCDKQLAKYEDRLGLIARDREVQDILDEIDELVKDDRAHVMTDKIRELL